MPLKTTDVNILNGQFIGDNHYRLVDGRVYSLPDEDLIWRAIHFPEKLTKDEIFTLGNQFNTILEYFMSTKFAENRRIIKIVQEMLKKKLFEDWEKGHGTKLS